MSQIKKEPPISPQSQRVMVEVIAGNEKASMGDGNYIYVKAKILSGNYNRVAQLFDLLESLGMDVNKERTAFFAPTIGFTPTLTPGGVREEIVNILTQSPPMPKQNEVRKGSTEILSRTNQPEQPSEQ